MVCGEVERGEIEMIKLSELYDGLEEMQSFRNCNDCSIDCPYYISGNYGKECALETVINQIGMELRNLE